MASHGSDLTQGNIVGSLVRLAIPIMGASFVQMAYNMTNMVWLGHLSSAAVAAVGTAGFFPWLGASFMMLAKVGAEVTVSQSIGRKDPKEAAIYAASAMQIAAFFTVLYAVVIFLLARDLVGFLGLKDGAVTEDAVVYLRLIAGGLLFININPVLAGIYNGAGNSRVPFVVCGVGLALNMLLDPILIYGFGPIAPLGVMGAGIATLASQTIVTFSFLWLMAGRRAPIKGFRTLLRPSLPHLKRILSLGAPVGAHSALFTLFAILIARVIAHWGPVPIAVQKVGAQIEAISWMTASGFASALGAFVGQNLGAQKYARIVRGYLAAVAVMGAIGLAATLLLVHWAAPIFSLFMPQMDAMPTGTRYLEILGWSQLFMCLEITTGGAFNGLSKSLPPSLVGITFNAMRVPLAMALSSAALWGLDGVWWSVSLTSIIKGIILVSWFMLVMVRHPALRVALISLMDQTMLGRGARLVLKRS